MFKNESEVKGKVKREKDKIVKERIRKEKQPEKKRKNITQEKFKLGLRTKALLQSHRKQGKPKLEKEKQKRLIKEKRSFKERIKEIRNIRINWRGIRLKLIGAFIVPVVLIIILGVVSYRKASSGIINNYEAAVKDTMGATDNYFSLAFKSIETSAIQIGSEDGTIDSEEYKQYKSIQKSIVSKLGADNLMKNIHVIHVDDVVMSTRVSYLIRKNIYPEWSESAEMSVFANEDTDIVWIGEHPNLDEKFGIKPLEYSVSVIKRVTDATGLVQKGGTTKAFVVIDVKKETVTDVLAALNWGKGSYAGLITADGREISMSTKVEGEESQIFDSIDSPAESLIFSNEEFYKNALASEETSGAEYVTYNGKEYLFLYSGLDTSGSVICGLIPKNNITSQADEIRSLTVWFVIGASIVAICIGTVLASGMSKAIKGIIRVLGKTASGDFTEELDIRRKDEFGILSDSVNHMTRSMKSLIEDVTVVSGTVTVSTEEVKQSSDVLYIASKEILTAIDEVEKGIVKQAEDAESCLKQMSSLSNKVNVVYENANSIEQIATGTKAVADKGIVIIDDLAVKTKQTADITNVVIKNIEQLSRESLSIKGIISTINEIAEQTTLLSLNASIEAARAGAAGRGFSVVAAEIRKLAEQSVKAVEQIQDIVETIQGRTTETVKTATKAEEIVEVQVKALEKTIAVFNDITERVDGLTVTLVDIANDVKEIERSKDETLDAMESISAVAQETAAVSEEIANSASSQLDAVEKMNSSTVELAGDTKTLNKAVSIFKV